VTRSNPDDDVIPSRPSERETGNVAVRRIEAARHVAQGGSRFDDWVAVEEPLEIRISGEVVATTLRTPGADRALALGFLYAEGAIVDVDDVTGVLHCGRPGTPEYGNVVEVTPSPGHTLQSDPIARLRASAVITSACGVCGREQITALAERCSSLTSDDTRLSFDAVMSCVDQLDRAQTHFQATGGLHAAGLFAAGTLLGVAEDVGRHNAVDKVIGQALLDGTLPARGGVLAVTSRAGFEIVQKACVARLPVVICFSAPTSLAIETARELGVTLIGFARAGAFNVYSAPERITT